MVANQEYIITIYDEKDWPSLWEELTVDGLGDNHIPKRGIEVLNGRPYNARSAHFSLTPEEAAEIRLDPRVEAVDLEYYSQTEKRANVNATRNGNYRVAGVAASEYKNWGLVSGINATRQYTEYVFSILNAYHYVLDGDGVDIIITDTGVEPNHPEFAVNIDGTGGSRVVDFNWASLGVPGTLTAAEMGGYLGDPLFGHGTSMASVAAGNTHGWASKAAIYSIRAFSTAAVNQNLNIVFDLVTAFHLAKIAAGNPRPTICSNSWGYDTTYTGMQQTVYRGDTYNNTTPSITYDQWEDPVPIRDAAADAAIASCIGAGVIIVASAGNSYQTMHLPSADPTNDYNNYFVKGDQVPVYYGRGQTPGATPGVICVGAHSATQYLDNDTTRDVECKSYFSNCGPRVDVFAPGFNIASATPHDSPVNHVNDLRNIAYAVKRGSGTSEACAQVAGVVALLAQLDPLITNAQARSFISTNAIVDRLEDNDFPGDLLIYPNYKYYALRGSPNKVLYFPYSLSTAGYIPPEGPTMLDFPTSPSLNQEYSVAGKTWRWNGTAWRLVWVSPVPGVGNFGYLIPPQNIQSADYTLVLADAGKQILHPTSDNNTRIFTIPANASVAFEIGTKITFVNQINTLTIAITTDTLKLAGAGTTGSRTLAANGEATVRKLTATEWLISGTGLT